MKLGHQPNPPNSIVVTELPMVNESVKPSQPPKAHAPTVVTELGMVSEPVRPSASKNIYAAIGVERRNDLRRYLEEKGIKTGVYFPVPFHKQTVFENNKCINDGYPNAEYVAEHTLVIPMFPELTEEEITRVIDAVNEWKG